MVCRGGGGGRWMKNNVPGRQLVTAQFHKCFLCSKWGGSSVSSLGGTHKLQRSYIDTHSTMDEEQKGRYVTGSCLTIGSSPSLPVQSFPHDSLFFPPLPSVHFTLNHFTTTLPFCQNTIFLLLFIVFLLQNMYRLFRTTTKIQYPIYMQFLSFNSYQFIRWILLEFLFLLIVPSPLSQMAYSPSEYWRAGGRGEGHRWSRYK